MPISRQHASTEVTELHGKACDALLGVAGDVPERVLFFYLRADGTWFRGVIDVGVFFFAEAEPDRADDLEAGAEYVDLGKRLGVQDARIVSFGMQAGVLRIVFDAGEPFVLRE